MFEELIRKFAELSNETAGEHFTPREVIRLMVNLLFIEDDDALTKPGVVRSIYDPTAGTGGMLSVAGEHLAELNPQARLVMYGQELNPESYAICKADMLIKGQDIANIIFGNTLSDDGHAHAKFDYMLSNPPFGVEWKKIEKEVRKEHEQQGFNGRFGPGLPRVSRRLAAVPAAPDLQDAPGEGWRQPLRHRPQRLAAVHRRRGLGRERNPPLRAGERSGRGHHRPADRHVLQHRHQHLRLDRLATASPPHRKGKVQLIDASSFWQKMRKSLGSKRKELSAEHIATSPGCSAASSRRNSRRCSTPRARRSPGRRRRRNPDAPEGGKVKLAPLSASSRTRTSATARSRSSARCATSKGKIVLGTKGKQKGKPQPDAALRDTENVPLSEDVETYFKREVLPHAPDAWIDTRRRRSATRSRSTGTSTSSSRRARWPRSTPS